MTLEAVQHDMIDALSNLNLNPCVRRKRENQLEHQCKINEHFTAKPAFKTEQFANIVVRHVKSPLKFYVIQDEKLEDLQELQDDLQASYSMKADSIYKPRVGDFCAVNVDDIWYRCRNEKLENDIASVRLVDFGYKKQVQTENLRMLKTRHAEIPCLVTLCKVSLLKPLPDSSDTKYHQNIKKRFKSICSYSKNLQIYVKKSFKYFCEVYLYVNHVEECLSVSAYMLNEKYAAFNIELLQKELMKKTAGQAMRNYFPQIRDIEKPHDFLSARKTSVELVHIESPAEIYICPKKMVAKYRKFHFDIQNIMEAHVNLKKPRKWEVGDQCLLHTKLSILDPYELKMWYRAVVTCTSEPNHVSVFLRDFGVSLAVAYIELVPMADTLAKIPNRVLKCHLNGLSDCIKNSVKDDLVKICSEYKNFAVSTEQETGPSLSIVLWGMYHKYEDTRYEKVVTSWTIINSCVMEKHILRLTEKFTKKTDVSSRHFQQVSNCDNDWDISETVNQVATYNIGEDIDLEHYLDETEGPLYNFTLELNEVHEWLPPVSHDMTIFTGKPTYVDRKCVIYLQTIVNQFVARKMKLLIQKSLKARTAQTVICNWKENQPCLAKYLQDNNFYRAVILRVNREDFTCIVKFVDYGNVEICNFEDLRIADIFGDIPIQSHRYYVDGIKPFFKTSDNRWPVSVTDFCHMQIVDKLCSVRITNVERRRRIMPCSISGGPIDLKTLLLHYKIVKETKLD